LGAIRFKVGQDGKLEADFSEFERQIEICIQEGLDGRIIGSWLGAKNKRELMAEYFLKIVKVENGKVVRKLVEPTSEDAEQYCSWFLPLLVERLREKGWLERYIQCVGDEPNIKNFKGWRKIAKLVRKYAPELKIGDAVHTKNLVGAIDVWVPNLRFFPKEYEHYKKRQDSGDELWFYTAVNPQGEYANRFIEQRLIKTRLLHWINFRYGFTGYIRWGYNNWLTDDPFKKMTIERKSNSKYLPAGDAWIVYPGKNGPIDSIRHEAMRDGIADYELLCMLNEHDKTAAQRLAAKHIIAFNKYDCDVKTFRQTRQELLGLLSRCKGRSKIKAEVGVE
jgi:hypothetical protein